MDKEYTFKKIQKLHTTLNILDVYKDAFLEKHRINTETGKELFIKTTNKLFNRIENYSSLKTSFEKDIKKLFKKNYKSLPITKTKIYNKTKSAFGVPKNIKAVVYDTGINPLYLRPDLSVIITPATYIDPAPKLKEYAETKIKRKYIEFTNNLKINNFIEFGIKDIIKLESDINLETKNCEINLSFSFNQKLNVIFNEKSVPINGNKEYFFGNATKNNWFSSQKNNNNSYSVTHEGEKYILCKLIGDLLQAYYLKIIVDKLQSKPNYALITIDNNLKCRCILFNIPVIVKNHLNNASEYMFYSSHTTIMSSFKQLYLDLVIEHNENNIELIQKIITNGSFIIGEDIIQINTNIGLFLNNMIHEIKNANILIKTIDAKMYKDLDNYRKEIYKYQSFFVFGNLEDKYLLYQNNTTRLFPGLFSETDIIYTTEKTIDDYIFSIATFRGGAKDDTIEVFVDKYFNNGIYEDIDFTDYKDYRDAVNKLEGEDENYDALELCLYYHLLKFEEDPLVIYNELQVLNGYFGLYLDYTGKLITNDKFIYSIVKRYKEDKLRNLTFTEFETLFKNWYMSVRKPYDDPFIGTIGHDDENYNNNENSNEYMNDDDDNNDDEGDNNIMTPEKIDQMLKNFYEKEKQNKINAKTRKRKRSASTAFQFALPLPRSKTKRVALSKKRK
jgi:hypothetical protein